MGLKHNLQTWAGAMLGEVKIYPAPYILKHILVKDGEFEVDWWDKAARTRGFIVTFHNAYSRDDLLRLCNDLRIPAKPMASHDNNFSMIVKHMDEYPDMVGMDRYGYPIIADKDKIQYP